ncbi:MAG: DEAD/DEAH box helicase [Flavobacteriales bacterium]|jgi:ATP-dependent RNA helicase DeaD|nr:DEAD/DEAH box helicase [Flavobacteriales bacterium]
MTFNELGLRAEVLRALEDLGFESPTPIQEKSIPQLLSDDRDLVGLAQTGTGKTAAFGLPLIESVDFNKKYVQAVVIAPTRELGIQIAEDFKIFTKYIKGASIATIYGGASIDVQAREIKRGAQIVVATPGRLNDMIRRNMVKLNQVSVAVLDEADEMLNMGFKEDIDTILDQTPEDKNVWLFSATMPKEVARIASTYMDNPIEVTVGTKNAANTNIHHVYYTINDRNRYFALKRMLDYYPEIYGLVFCRTKRLTQEIADKLMKDGYSAAPLHGDLSQSQRDHAMRKFRDKTVQILVATDVAARGIDVNEISHVIHYNLPEEVENYNHRSGRTGRAGRKGQSISFATGKELGRIKSIERVTKLQIEHASIPSGKEVCEKQLFALINNVKNVEVKEEDIENFLPSIFEQLADFSKEEVIKKFVSAEFNHFLEYYDGARDLNSSVSDREKERGNREAKRREKTDDTKQRFHIAVGTNSGLNKGAVLRIVCQFAKISSNEVGRIDLFKEFSFFDVDKKYADQVLDGMKDAEFNDEPFRIQFAKSNGGGKSRSSRGNGRRRSDSRERNSGGGRDRDRRRRRRS